MAAISSQNTLTTKINNLKREIDNLWLHSDKGSEADFKGAYVRIQRQLYKMAMTYPLSTRTHGQNVAIEEMSMMACLLPQSRKAMEEIFPLSLREKFRKETIQKAEESWKSSYVQNDKKESRYAPLIRKVQAAQQPQKTCCQRLKNRCVIL